ncbi:Proline-rich receptor-like protein kinase PERK8 [Quillaja saponaria]|uniref:non-specific serine/threonine protein kinase n=1 Tax=Quillaja saponaria TaxID=32244 RepID=A0AAD7L220_QUISA|nr:Proline-rich receptor-like protein kinase PERK8 [Quillaja saponaria]
MSAESQKVVVIQNASRDVSTSAIKLALATFSLKRGDELTLLAILHKVNNPMGYRIKVDSSSIIGTTQKIIEEEVSRRTEDYQSNAEIMRISKHCAKRKIMFRIEVLPGPGIALNAILSLRATLVILDRQMKKDKKYFTENLDCGMLRIKRNNSIEWLSRPELAVNVKFFIERRSTGHIKYQEMVDGSPGEQLSPEIGHPEGQSLANTERETAQNYSLFSIFESQETEQREVHPGRPVESQDQHSYNNETSQMEEEFKNSICTHCNNRRPTVGWKRDFSYAELLAATKGFSKKNFLSEGGFGSVFRGEIDGMKIAVKQHKSASLQGEKEFKSEVQALSRARHENLVMLLGSCSDGNHRLLVYEYVCNGSLDQHLPQYSRTLISWDDRLGDFGLARKHEDPDHSSETRVVGTLGYLAPEYAEYGKVSTKTDVYSFGVVLLQLITGMRTIDKRLGGKSLVGWVVQALSGIWEGKTICVRGYSPGYSDSPGSLPDTPVSENITHGSPELLGEEESFYKEPSPESNVSQMSTRFLSSPPMGSTSTSGSSSSSTLHDESFGTNNEKKRGISKSKSGLFYDDMID